MHGLSWFVTQQLILEPNPPNGESFSLVATGVPPLDPSREVPWVTACQMLF